MKTTLTFAGVALSALHGTALGATDGHASSLLALTIRDGNFASSLSTPFNVGVHNMYAGHRSHSSHASHSSHYSGSGGSYQSPSTPTPYYAAPVAPAEKPTDAGNSPSADPKKSTNTTPATLLSSPNTAPVRPSADQLQMMIMRVQAALYSKGYDPGAIDGVLTAPTKLALRKFQTATHLSVTGTMSTETLSALGVALNR